MGQKFIGKVFRNHLMRLKNVLRYELRKMPIKTRCQTGQVQSHNIITCSKVSGNLQVEPMNDCFYYNSWNCWPDIRNEKKKYSFLITNLISNSCEIINHKNSTCCFIIKNWGFKTITWLSFDQIKTPKS